jgi:hypothetical protein
LSTLTVFDPDETQKPGSLFWYDFDMIWLMIVLWLSDLC